MMAKKERKLIYQGARIIFSPFFKIIYRPKIINAKLIPKKGPIIICGNHTHKFDPFLITSSTRRTAHFMAKHEYHQGKLKHIFKAVGTIPVNRSIKDIDASSRALEVLKQGGVIALFPEGTRNKTEQFLLEFKLGAVSMASKTGATIVPFGISGKFEKNKDNNLMIRYGKPFKVGKMSLPEANKKLREEVGRLMIFYIDFLDHFLNF